MKCVLITNVSSVRVGDVDLTASALLLEQGSIGPTTLCRVRGFGPDEAWDVFTIHLASIDHEVRPVHPPPAPDGWPQYPVTQHDVVLAGGPTLHVMVADPTSPLDVQTFDGADTSIFAAVWEALRERTAAYWPATRMPRMQWVPHVRRLGPPVEPPRYVTAIERAIRGVAVHPDAITAADASDAAESDSISREERRWLRALADELAMDDTTIALDEVLRRREPIDAAIEEEAFARI